MSQPKNFAPESQEAIGPNSIKKDAAEWNG